MYNILLSELVQTANAMSDAPGSAEVVAILKPLTAAINGAVAIATAKKQEVLTKYAEFTQKYIKDGRFNMKDVADKDLETSKQFTAELLAIDKMEYELPGFGFGEWFLKNLSLNQLSLLYIATSHTSSFDMPDYVIAELEELKQRFIESRDQ